MDHVAEIKAALEAGDNPMTFKKELAFTITQKLHGQADAQKAAQHFENSIQNKAVPEVEQFLPLIIKVEGERCSNDVFSNSQLNRLLAQGAVKL